MYVASVWQSVTHLDHFCLFLFLVTSGLRFEVRRVSGSKDSPVLKVIWFRIRIDIHLFDATSFDSDVLKLIKAEYDCNSEYSVSLWQNNVSLSLKFLYTRHVTSCTRSTAIVFLVTVK
jgi:hypothetical protein